MKFVSDPSRLEREYLTRLKSKLNETVTMIDENAKIHQLRLSNSIRSNAINTHRVYALCAINTLHEEFIYSF